MRLQWAEFLAGGMWVELLKLIALAVLSSGALTVALTKRRANGRRRWLLLVGGLVGTGFTVLVAVLGGAQLIGAGSEYFFFLMSLLLLIAGVILTRRGLRGRLVGDRPSCRACGYDLTGRPDGVDLCSECGHDLTIPTAIQVGDRKRRPRLLASGLTCLIVSISLAASVIWKFEDIRINWRAQLPGSMLISRYAKLTTNNFSGIDEYVEIQKRFKNGTLSDSQIRLLARKALDPSAPRTLLDDVFWILLSRFESLTAQQQDALAASCNGSLSAVISESESVPEPVVRIHAFERMVAFPNGVVTIGRSEFTLLGCSINSTEIPLEEVLIIPESKRQGYLRISKTVWDRIESREGVEIRIRFNVRTTTSFETIKPDREIEAEHVVLAKHLRRRTASTKTLEHVFCDPKEEDLTAIWSAEVSESTFLGQKFMELKVTRSKPASRVFGHVELLSNHQAHVIGRIDVSEGSTSDKELVNLPDGIEDGPLVIRIRPDATIRESVWPEYPILNQIVVIDDVKVKTIE